MQKDAEGLTRALGALHLRGLPPDAQDDLATIATHAAGLLRHATNTKKTTRDQRAKAAALALLSRRDERHVVGRVLAAWRAHTDKAIILRNMRNALATPPRCAAAAAASADADDAAGATDSGGAAARTGELVDALFGVPPESLRSTTLLRKEVLGDLGGRVGSTTGSTTGDAGGGAPVSLGPRSVSEVSTSEAGEHAREQPVATPPSDAKAGALAATGLMRKLQHLSVENAFLRERTAHCEASVQLLSRDVEEKRQLLHHVYTLHRQALLQGSTEDAAWSFEPSQFAEWALPGLSRFLGREARRREREVADSMEVVLEETLKHNIRLQSELARLRGQDASVE